MEDETYSTPINFHWTNAQEAIVMAGVRNITSHKNIMRNIIEAKAYTSGKYPNMKQHEATWSGKKEDEEHNAETLDSQL